MCLMRSLFGLLVLALVLMCAPLLFGLGLGLLIIPGLPVILAAVIVGLVLVAVALFVGLTIAAVLFFVLPIVLIAVILALIF